MPKVNRTLKRALDVLQLLKDEQKPLSNMQLSVALDMPRSSTLDILNTLLVEGYIEYANGTQKTYVLGLKAFEIGAAYLRNTDLFPTVRPYLEKLMLMADATAFLATEHKGQLVYLDKFEAPASVRTTATLGSRTDMYCSGLGKSLLATYSESTVKKIYDKTNIITHTKNTITDFYALIKELENTRLRGYAIDNSEAHIEVFCIAAPIYNYTNKAIAAISVSMMISKVNESLIEKYAQQITDSAFQISKRLGFSKEKLYYEKR